MRPGILRGFCAGPAVLIILAVLLAAPAAWSCSPAGTPTQPLTIGTAPLESSALVYIAEVRRFFSENHLDVTVKEFETGAAAHSALLKGEVDMAIPAEYPMVGSAFKKEGGSIIASIDKADYFFLMARKDRGIDDVSDLEGKRVGLVIRTIAEFYFGRFLTIHGMDAGQVTIVNTSYAQSGDAIINGTVDAVVSRPPYVGATRERLGANAAVWPVQSSQALYAVLTARNDWIAGHSRLVRDLLRSLALAEQYLVKHPAEARTIVQQRLKFDEAYMTEVWSQNQFSLALDQSLVVAMEDEARWMIANNLTTEKDVPNFNDYIYEDALQAVKPEAVNIIR